MVEVNTAEQIEVKDSGVAVAYVINNVEVEKATDLNIRVAKKEYNIVGDDIYIPQLYDDAPQWMKDLVQLVVDVSLESGTTDLVNQLNSTLSAFATSYVPLNQYTQSIVSLQDADTAINSLITTLNSTYNDGISNLSAQVIELQNTKANATEVVAQVISTINSELISPTSNLNATIGNLQQTIANEASARAANFETISSTLETLDGSIEGNATAITGLNTYVGITNGVPNGTGLLANVAILQKQNDGIIETFTDIYDVILNPQDPQTSELVVSAEPYVSWLGSEVGSGIDVRLSHIGDVYIKYAVTTNGAREYIASYKFIRTAVDNTSPYSTDSEGFTWALVIDQAAQDAYEQALNAYDLADNKRRVFLTTPVAPIDEGDLWIDNTTVPQVVKVYKNNIWVIADTQTIEFANEINPKVVTLQNQVDGKVEYYFYETYADIAGATNEASALDIIDNAWSTQALREAANGNVVYFKETDNGYWYSSALNSWLTVDDTSMMKALREAEQARLVADSKITSYYIDTFVNIQALSNSWTTAEKASNVGDLATVWNDTTLDNNGLWRWNGTNWISARDKKLVALASNVTNLSTELSNGTNTWAGADSTLENSLRTEITDEGARVESKFAYNSNVNINGVWKKSGFGLTTNYTSGSGTEGDPYLSEFWINASKLKFTNDNVTGQVAPFTIEANGVTPQITFNGVVNFTNTNISNGYPGTTKINGGVIESNTITAAQINTVGLIAENISANEIIGKTITGSSINGATINGAVIKASYLDLDGELEVLTNYHITPAMYTANPSLYTDAVYISGSNEYRIPSISTVRESTTTIDIPLGSSEYNSLIHSYSMATAGNNIKAVRINPQVLVSSDINLVDISFIPAYYDVFGSRQGPWLNKNSFYDIEVKVAGNTCTFRFYTGGYDRVFNTNVGPAYYAGVTAYLNGSYVISYPIGNSIYTDSRYDYNTNIKIGGLLFNVSTKNTYGTGEPGEGFGLAISTSFRLKLISGSYQLPNWSNNESLIRVITSNITNPGTLTFNQYPGEGDAFAYKNINNSTAISINNMI